MLSEIDTREEARVSLAPTLYSVLKRNYGNPGILVPEGSGTFLVGSTVVVLPVTQR